VLNRPDDLREGGEEQRHRDGVRVGERQDDVERRRDERAATDAGEPDEKAQDEPERDRNEEIGYLRLE
jgi:hypothetical protein